MNRRLVGMSALAVLLGGYVVADYTGWPQLSGGGGTPAPSLTAQRADAAVKLNPLQGLDPAAYPDVTGRPLFNPSRQPRPVEPPPPPPPPVVEQPVEQPPPAPQGPGPEDYRLVGVASGPDGRIAALRVAASGQVIYVRKGGTVDSWSIIDVGDRSVAIGTPDNPVTFKLFDAQEAGAGGGDMGGDPAGGVPPQPPGGPPEPGGMPPDPAGGSPDSADSNFPQPPGNQPLPAPIPMPQQPEPPAPDENQ